jgi:hypothetical protein
MSIGIEASTVAVINRYRYQPLPLSTVTRGINGCQLPLSTVDASISIGNEASTAGAGSRVCCDCTGTRCGDCYFFSKPRWPRTGSAPATVRSTRTCNKVSASIIKMVTVAELRKAIKECRRRTATSACTSTVPTHMSVGLVPAPQLPTSSYVAALSCTGRCQISDLDPICVLPPEFLPSQPRTQRVNKWQSVAVLYVQTTHCILTRGARGWLAGRAQGIRMRCR